MSAFEDLQQSAARLRQRADEQDKQRRLNSQEDVVIEFPRRLFLRAPGGAFFQITVSDAGDLTATAFAGTPL